MKNTKTILQWAEELPEPVKSRFLRNLDHLDEDAPRESLERAIQGAFRWLYTIEDYDYWLLVSQGKYHEAEALLNAPAPWPQPEPAPAPLPLPAVITKREYFAAMAMQALIVNVKRSFDFKHEIAKEAVDYANALISQLNQKS